jgi:TolB-like protein/class 3 adenylate cyclase/tetratricopeptide (TPR) repeat protein
VANVERRLAGIMFTDIVGYTALMAESEAKGLRAREQHRAVLGPLAERYRGQIVDENGDELVLSFPSALDAVNCALAVQAELRDDPELRLRIGVHLGDVVFEAGRVYGDGVNVASRIRPLAEPGGICVSDEVQHSIQNQENIETRSLGEHELKNVPRSVQVFAVTGMASVPRPAVAAAHARERRTGRWAAGAAVGLVVVVLGAWWWAQSVPDLAPIRSIAVLPLENLSGDPEQEYFADGMTEALIGELAKLGSLRVISRTSVGRYKQSDKSLPEIAAELAVAGVVEGTVLREGERIRVTAQLIDARSDTHVWNDTYDREMSGVLALQSDVAHAVAEAVGAVLTGEERVTPMARPHVDPRAYDAYLRGLEARGSGASALVGVWAPRAIDEFERAVELDPDFAEAYAALAFAREWLGNNPFDVRYRREFPKAREAAQRALELDDRLGAAHAVLGSLLVNHEWDFEAGRRALARAVQLSPSDPTALNHYAWYLIVVERTEEAFGVMERLLRVAPFDGFYRGIRVRNFSWARQDERVLEELARVRELDPDFVELEVAVTYFKLGRLEEAHLAHVAFYERCGPPCDWMLEAIQRGWSDGRWNASIRTLAEAAGEREGYSPWLVAYWYSMIGETDEALDWLERGYREHDPVMVLSKALPVFDPLRSDPRFDDLLRRIGFPES